MKPSPKSNHLAAEGFSKQELIRYQRHFVLGSVGLTGQKKLKAARVLVVGLGGLGVPVAQYLAAAGVGTLGLLEFDHIELSNLQRQVLYATQQVGQKKLGVALKQLSQLNPEIKLIPHAIKAEKGAEAVLQDYDLILDATDNFPTRYWLNDCCSHLGKPNVHGSVYQFEGQVSIFCAPQGPCYRCLFPRASGSQTGSQNCSEAGVVGAVVGIIGCLQANEAIKWLLEIGDHAIGKILVFDALNLQWRTFKLMADPNCPTCGTGRLPDAVSEDAVSEDAVSEDAVSEDAVSENTVVENTVVENTVVENTVVENTETPWQIEPVEFKVWQTRGTDYQLLDVREDYEYQIVHLDGLWIPLKDLKLRLAELEDCKNRKLLVVCQHGKRSAEAAQFLLQQGFKAVYSLKGGLDQYSLQVDPNFTRY